MKRYELQVRRVAAGLTQEDLAEILGISVQAVRAWERGVSTPAPFRRQAVADALGITLDRLAVLLDPPTGPELDGHLVPPDLTHYESLVLEAARVHVFARAAIHWVLQTRDYAFEVERLDALAGADEIEQRVETRLTRQSVLHREPPLHLTAVVPEGLLRDGGHELANQLAHLLDRAQRPNVDLLVMPTDGSARAYPAEFELITKPGAALPFIAVVFGPDGYPHYHEHDVGRYIRSFDSMSAAALPPDQSAETIAHILKEHR